MIKHELLLNAKKLLEDGIIVMKRNSQNQIIPYANHMDNLSSNEIYIRYGQLNSDQHIHGIGRKICLFPKDNKESIREFREDLTYIDEGEFLDDDLNGTFGRRIYMHKDFEA